METLTVDLKENSYKIHIGHGIIHDIHEIEQDLQYKHRSLAIISDEGVAKNQKDFLDALFKECPRLILPAGECSKSIQTLEEVYEFLADQKLDRKSVLFAVGGGVIGDLTGFAAATFMRGIDFYQIPTTLLGMIDSSIGGKTGINLKEGKNMVGAFHQPKAIFIDIDCLNTLPKKQFTAGMAEIIKYGLLGDKELFEYLEKDSVVTSTSESLPNIIKKSCAIKAAIVSSDEKDITGRRAILNLGHTFAHAIENVAGYGEYLHGEAVAIGLICAARLSEILGHLDEDNLKRIKTTIEKYDLPTQLKKPLPINELIETMRHDKKTIAGELNFIVMKKIGEAQEHKRIDEKWLHVILREVGASAES